MELIDKLITGGTILYMYYTVDKCSHFPQNGGAVAALEGPTSESQKCCSYGPTDMVEGHNCGFTLLEIEQRPWTSSFFSWKLIFQTPYLAGSMLVEGDGDHSSNPKLGFSQRTWR